MEGTLGEIRIFAGSFAPANWAFCNGEILSIAQYEALFVLIGTTYGGDGVNTFALPNLQSRIPIGTGQGPGLPNVVLGQMGGTETVTMSVNQMPGHNHLATANISLAAFAGTDTQGSPTGAVFAGAALTYSDLAADTNLKSETVTVNLGSTGQGAPIDIIQPYQALNYIICKLGIFPSRN
ncbi:phage tail protein [Flavobacterium artemisiae]|uniref:Phage tail protein n=1 Tax=Flavobacterium artemisiae TaxID=2126556 RepID=A0ABW4HC36_9FLAO